MRWRLLLAGFLGAITGCGEDPTQPTSERVTPWDWGIPDYVPAPLVPEDNPMSEAKVRLGRSLFYDERLSANQSQSCASCHDQARAFTEPKAVSVGSTGQSHVRNAQGLSNVAYASSLTWANPILSSLELQNTIPIFGETPVELGAVGNEEKILSRFRADSAMVALFQEAFPGEDEVIRFDLIIKSLSAFQRTLLSFDSPYDRYLQREGELSEAAKRGLDLFFSERLECTHCHGGILFSEASVHEGSTTRSDGFFNTGLFNIDGMGSYPVKDPGLFEVTGHLGDMGHFRAPSLRNVAATAPYFHDGSAATLEEVIDIYARGGRLIESGPNAGDGKLSPLKSAFLTGFQLSPDERFDLIAFLESLTDPTFLSNPSFSNPAR